VLIGREGALGVLETQLRSSAAGAGRTALLSGEAGIGKSRLLRELLERAQARGMQTLAGRCFEQDRGLPYGPVIDLLRRIGADHDAGPGLEGTPLELLNLLPERAPKRLTGDPEGEKRKIFAAMSRWLRDRAGGQPLILAVEDLHWCDDISLELLLHLARGSRRSLRSCF